MDEVYDIKDGRDVGDEAIEGAATVVSTASSRCFRARRGNHKVWRALVISLKPAVKVPVGKYRVLRPGAPFVPVDGLSHLCGH